MKADQNLLVLDTACEISVGGKSFYKKYLSPDVVWVEDEEDDKDIEHALGKYAIESCRIDLLPTVALERLGLHNELCALKWSDPNKVQAGGVSSCGRARCVVFHMPGSSATSSPTHLHHPHGSG